MPPINKDYIAVKIFDTKRQLQTQKDISGNIEQYAGVRENVLRNVHSKLQQAISNNIAKVKQNGQIITISDRRAKRKARRNNLSKALWALPIIGWVLYLALYCHYQRRFKQIKKEEQRQLKEALINALESNPAFLETAEKYISNLKGKEKKLYEQCLRAAHENMQNGSGLTYGELIDKTVDVLKLQNEVNIDKQLLEKLSLENLPEQLSQELETSKTNKKMSLCLSSNCDNSALFKQLQQKKNQTVLNGPN